jgi:hypothetical protein
MEQVANILGSHPEIRLSRQKDTTEDPKSPSVV